MNRRYLEIDSTYRNREQYPLPSDFSVFISQSGTRDVNQARDPVSSSAPIKEWIPADISNGTVVLNSNNTTSKLLVKFPSITPIQPLTPPNRQIKLFIQGYQ